MEMIDIDWSAVLVTGASLFALLIIGVFLLIGACMIIANEITRRHDEQAEEAMASMPDHVLIDAIRLFDGQ
jgi:hypothetical protein